MHDDELIAAWERGELKLMEADPETHQRLMAALDEVDSKELPKVIRLAGIVKEDE
ncbi:hypothetical protein KIW74_gp55 [Mycobacterium phage Kimona]|uniref:Uncharacterized protein n=1 Tax=Mycobacterium phage Kimona TaxID=2024295 RepID=A0A249XU03_9CAUD|nr:hypothetical protein KIW74_gp55 [Mycobacterium phage Kimona]ASZ75473.1 hypothetical protein PBI_KIMONA_37 [Mycobacterium phage Kimona]